MKRLLLKLKIIKQTKLSEENKKLQMDNFYKIDPERLFKKQLNDKFNLSAWRKSLISNIKIREKVNFLDLGCGLGAYSSLILSEYKRNINNGYLIDFSTSGHNFLKRNFSKNNKITLINDYAITALERIEDKSINYAIIFGFLHEINDRKNLLELLKKKLSDKYILLFSDNCLYFTAEDVNNDFNKAGFKGFAYEKKLSLFCFHFFKKIGKNRNGKKYKMIIKIGKVDSVVGIYTSGIIIKNKHSILK